MTSIEKERVEDLNALDLDNDADGYTPYYIKVRVDGVDASSENPAYATLGGYMFGLLPDGTPGVGLRVYGTFDVCGDSGFGTDFDATASAEVCIPYMAKNDTATVGARWAEYETPYATHNENPIVWTE